MALSSVGLAPASLLRATFVANVATTGAIHITTSAKLLTNWNLCDRTSMDGIVWRAFAVPILIVELSSPGDKFVGGLVAPGRVRGSTAPIPLQVAWYFIAPVVVCASTAGVAGPSINWTMASNQHNPASTQSYITLCQWRLYVATVSRLCGFACATRSLNQSINTLNDET